MKYKKIIKKIIPLLLIGAFLLVFKLALAQDFGTDVVSEGLGGALGEADSDPRSLASRIINIAMGFLGVIAVSIVLYSGFLWMTSSGEEEKVGKAKKILKAGLIGLVIVLSAWAIVTFVFSKLSGAINGNDIGGGNGKTYCFNGETRSCGCGGAMLCSNGVWGPCIGSNWDDCTNIPTDCDASSLSGCQASDQICADGYFCDDNCSCQEKAEAGDSCDADSSNQTCDADNNRCGSYLTCDPNTCLCVGSPVITGISPLGGFCENNINQPCASNDDCGGNVCNLSAANGAANNFITIFGKNFGDYSSESSQVVFAGSGQEAIALFPNNLNPACVNFWRDDQIIIAVPENAETGAIKVINDEGLVDYTNDDYGPQLPDFVFNSITRPGLCELDPVAGSLNLEVNYQGANLYNGQAYFGNYDSNVNGLYSNFSDDEGLSGRASVPNIKAGQTGSFVEKVVAGFSQKSNFLSFVKAREEADGPYMMAFSPSEGGPGQYVTIRGAGFGGAKGNSRVYFVLGNEKIEASYSFPSICTNSVWNDKQIIVKAPTDLTDGSYYIEIVLGDKIISSQTLNPNVFKFNSDLKPAPSLCKIDPEKGPIGSPVTLWGEYFGSVDANVITRFNYEKNVSGIVEKQDQADIVLVNVPKEATTGPVKIIRSNQAGNELNFTVAECSSDEECNGQVCCPSTSYKKGRCVNSLEECFADIPTSVFEWKFSTDFNTSNDESLLSCLGWSKYLGSCYQGAMCPNSPGACSSPTDSYTKVVGSCDLSCNSVLGCSGNKCVYNEEIDKCVLKPTLNVSACEVDELISPAKNSDKEDEKNIPRVIFLSGKINQHWNLSKGIFESDIEGVSNDEDKLAYCKKFYPTTVAVEEYKVERSSTWQGQSSGDYLTGEAMSYRCVLDTSVNGLDLSGVKKTCNLKGQWEINIKSSCPEGWTRGVNNTCVQENYSCSNCPDNLSCQTVDFYNSCVSKKLCDSQANCVDKVGSLEDECVATVEPGCDCCCRIGYDAQDCCAPLTCSGVCGSDIQNGSNTFGSCSGCAQVGSTPEEHDAACNCLGTSGKYCLVDDSNPQGVCTDCAGLTTAQSCGDHSATCCFDSRNTTDTSDDFCRSLKTSDTIVSTNSGDVGYGYCAVSSSPNPEDICNLHNNDKTACLSESGCCYNANPLFNNIYNGQSSFSYEIGACLSGAKIKSGENAGYCAYYDCTSLNSGTCNLTPNILGRYRTLDTCQEGCSNPVSGAGLGCVSKESNALGSCDFNTCTLEGFSCLQENGLEATSGDFPSCGVCCCQPETATSLDSCKTPATPNLVCQTNKGECSGSARGLCCGCTNDSDCGSVSTLGCGSDTCCEARPSVIGTLPAASEKNVCRNATISVSFNQKMDTSSFKDNFFLFEEMTYGKGNCPLENFIVAADFEENYQEKGKNNFLANLVYRISQTIRSLFNSDSQTALAIAPQSTKLYCAVSGKTSFMEEDAGTSVLFTPDKVLEANTKYYVLIKGDETLTSNTGVLSAAKIGMNGQGFDSQGNPVNPVSFNKKKYNNAYSFSFTTLPNQGGSNNSGLCLIDSIDITPKSYLFKTTVNDFNENDTDLENSTFDTIYDRDKLFTALVYSADKQILFPTNGYRWNFDWLINNEKIASISNAPIGLLENKKLIQAADGATDGSAILSARINMDAYRENCGAYCNAFFIGDDFLESSDIYVFLCENPWPAVRSDGTWYPWQDKASNCISTGTCDNFNYKFYYCRDAGEPGTFDDLPVINYSPVSLSGQLVCSTDRTSCSQSGSVCGSSEDGVCVWEVLKESYFFREAVISGVELISVTDTLLGGEAEIKWQSATAGVKAYKIYYLKSGQGTMLSKEVTPLGVGGVCSPAAGGLNYVCSTKIDGLVDGDTYIFKISLISDSQVESPFSNEKTIKTSDQTPPLRPTGLKATVDEEKVQFTWNLNEDKNVFYRLYYRLEFRPEAGYFDSAPGANSLVIPRDKFQGENYYFSLTALDQAKNESSRSVAVKVDLR